MTAARAASLLRLLNLTARPAVSAKGDMWYRSDLDQVRASDGGAGQPLTIGPTGNIPVVRSTGWHNLPGYGNAAGVNFPLDRLYAIPLWTGRSATLTGVSINVTTLLAASSVRMGLYESDGVLPTTLVADYGTVTTATTGLRTLTGLSSAVRPVLYFLALGRQGAAGTLGLSSRSTWEPIVSDTSPTIASNTNAYFIDGVSGALPGTFGTPAGTDQGPCCVVQLT